MLCDYHSPEWVCSVGARVRSEHSGPNTNRLNGVGIYTGEKIRRKAAQFTHLSILFSVVESAISILGLAEVRKSPIGDELKRGISGGQRKRVNIGIELVADVTVLWLDEPTRSRGILNRSPRSQNPPNSPHWIEFPYHSRCVTSICLICSRAVWHGVPICQ